jgi:phosphoribosylcarboxyaminoimidazole (NCAIR) mutase
MPGGIPVATFGIGNSGALNAILFAIHILSLNDENLKQKLIRFRKEQEDQVVEKSKRLKKKLKPV